MGDEVTGSLSVAARRELLGIARACAEAALKNEPPAPPVCDNAELQGHQGAFVTLMNHGRLRGCLGQFVAQEPLCAVVAHMAAAAATEDYRFAAHPVTVAELPDIDIEISVLSPMQRIANPLDIELGTHGIYIRRGFQAGTYLPQVATEHHMSKEEFLSSCCAHKAGLPPGAWKDPETEVFVYTAEVFGEKDLEE